MSSYGKHIAFELAKGLAELGIIITSGLALGIDSECHLGALESGKTIAVLGCGLNHLYSRSNWKLAEKISEHGAVISEFPPDLPANKLSFPQRNRIISGMCIATIVVEAALKSGSLITARLAAEQNREVLAVPGSIHSPQSKGCHYLIKQGAALVENIHDILFELKSSLSQSINFAETDLQKINKHDIDVKKAPEQYAAILKHIGSDSVSIDYLIEQTGLTPEQLSSMLLMMELEGLVRQVSLGYIRI